MGEVAFLHLPQEDLLLCVEEVEGSPFQGRLASYLTRAILGNLLDGAPLMVCDPALFGGEAEEAVGPGVLGSPGPLPRHPDARPLAAYAGTYAGPTGYSNVHLTLSEGRAQLQVRGRLWSGTLRHHDFEVYVLEGCEEMPATLRRPVPVWFRSGLRGEVQSLTIALGWGREEGHELCYRKLQHVPVIMPKASSPLRAAAAAVETVTATRPQSATFPQPPPKRDSLHGKISSTQLVDEGTGGGSRVGSIPSVVAKPRAASSDVIPGALGVRRSRDSSRSDIHSIAESVPEGYMAHGAQGSPHARPLPSPGGVGAPLPSPPSRVHSLHIATHTRSNSVNCKLNTPTEARRKALPSPVVQAGEVPLPLPLPLPPTPGPLSSMVAAGGGGPVAPPRDPHSTHRRGMSSASVSAARAGEPLIPTVPESEVPPVMSALPAAAISTDAAPVGLATQGSLPPVSLPTTESPASAAPPSHPKADTPPPPFEEAATGPLTLPEAPHTKHTPPAQPRAESRRNLQAIDQIFADLGIPDASAS